MIISKNIFSRTAQGHRFAALAPELWYVFYVRVSFSAYQVRFVGSEENVLDCIAFFYSFR